MRHQGNMASEKVKETTGKGNLRASSISTFSRCPMSFFFKFLHNLPAAIERRKEFDSKVTEAQLIRIRYSASASLGTAVHAGMETAIKAKMQGIENIDDMRELIHSKALEEWELLNKEHNLWYNIDKGENKLSMTEQLPDLVDAYIDDILPFVDNPTATEAVYQVKVSNPLIDSIQGSIDVEQENAVRDLKITSAKTRIDRHIAQLSTYAWIREQNSKPTDTVYIDNIAKNKTKITTAILEAKPKTHYIEHTLEQILYTIQMWYNSGCIGAGSDYLDLVSNKSRADEFKYLKMLFSGSNPSDDFLCNENWCDSWATCPFMLGWSDRKIIGEAIEI